MDKESCKGTKFERHADVEAGSLIAMDTSEVSDKWGSDLCE